MADRPRNLWNDSYALQVPVVDDQHRGFFDLAYGLDCSIDAGDDQRAVERAILGLKAYCQNHFITEERIMHEYGYPDLHGHLLLHDDFTRKVVAFEQDQEEGATGMPAQISAFLKEWMANHVVVEDKKWASFIRRQAPEKGAGVQGVPILVEVELAAKQPDTALCAGMSSYLMQQGISFVGPASSLDQTRSMLEELKSLGQAPAIFVVNTFGAKGMLAQLDSLMGDLPVLYLRRALYVGQSGLLDQVNLFAPGEANLATVALGSMKPRLASMWFYGARNTAKIAQRAAEAVNAFLRTGDFRQIERARSTY